MTSQNEQSARGLAARRAAETLLQTLGGATVVVRVPGGINQASDAAEMGAASIMVEDVTIHPVVVRTLHGVSNTGRGQKQLIFSAASLIRAREIYSASEAVDFFTTAIGVLLEDKLLRVEGVESDEFGGVPYLYRVVVGE